MAVDKQSVMDILKTTYKQDPSQDPAKNIYITHHDFLDSLVQNYLLELRKAEKEAKLELANEEEQLKEEDLKIKDALERVSTEINALQTKGAAKKENKPATLEELQARMEALEEQQAAGLTLLGQNTAILNSLHDRQVKLREMLAAYQERAKALEDMMKDYAIALQSQDKMGTARGRLNEAAVVLQKRLMLIQTYKNIEVVILYGMAVPSFALSIETFIIEAAYGDIAFERAGVELGLFLGLFASIIMMSIAAFLRKTLRHTWEVKVDHKLDDYKNSLNAFLKSIGHKDGTPQELEALIETNVTYARKNWAPFPDPIELDLVGFRTNALHEPKDKDGKDNKSAERIRHGERKDAWAAFYIFETLGALGAGIWLASEVHTQKERTRDLRPDLPDWVTPRPKEDSPQKIDMLSPEFIIIAVACVALLAALAAIIYRSRDSARGAGGVVRLSTTVSSSSSSLQKENVRPDPNKQ